MNASRAGTQTAEPDWIELVRRIRMGDAGALNDFCAALRRHVERLRPSAFRGSDASDLKQDVVERVWQKLSQFHGTTNAEFLGWVRQVVRTRAVNRARRRWRYKRLPEDSNQGVAVADSVARPSQPLMQEEDESMRQAALESLDEQDRQIIQLRLMEGREWVEITQQLGLSKETARKRYYRAVTRWRACYDQRSAGTADPSIRSHDGAKRR